MTIPTYLCAAPREDIDKLTAALATPGLAGCLINAPLNEPTFSTFLAQAAASDLPFDVRIPMLPAPFGMGTIKLGNNQILPLWMPDSTGALYVLNAWQAHVTSLMITIESNSLTSRFKGIRFSPRCPYPWDDEDGWDLAVPDHGTADLLAAGYTPAADIGAVAQAAAFLNTLPAGTLLSWCPFTPGDQPRFNIDTGLPDDTSDAYAIPTAVANAIMTNYTAGNTAFGFTRWDGVTPLGEFQLMMADEMGLILQTETGLTVPQTVVAISAAAALNPVRVEIHTSQVGALAG